MISYVIGACAGLSAALLVAGLFRPNPEAAVRQRVARYAPSEAVRTRSLLDRLVAPLLRRGAHLIVAGMPTKLLGTVTDRLDAAGLHVDVQRFVVIWAGVASGTPAFWLLLTVLGASLDGRALLAMLALCVLGALAPWLYLSGRKTERVTAIDRALPDAVDLIVTNIESGLALQAAMLNVAERFPGPVAEEFRRVIRETSIGRPREEAIEAMAQRIGSKDLQLFSRAVMQADRTGIPVGKVLRSQAIEIRRRRRQLAREKAGKLPVKMTILTVLFMFPTLFMLLLGPVVLNMMESFK